MEPPVDPQPLHKLPIRQQRLCQHLRQVDRTRIIVPRARYLNGDLDPGRLALHLAARTAPIRPIAIIVTVVTAAARLDQLGLAQGVARAVPRTRLLDLGFYADDRLGAIGEADPRAAIGAGQDVGLSAEGAELRLGAPVGSQWRGQRE